MPCSDFKKEVTVKLDFRILNERDFKPELSKAGMGDMDLKVLSQCFVVLP